MRLRRAISILLPSALIAACGTSTRHNERQAELYGERRPWYEAGQPPPPPGDADLASYIEHGLLHSASLRAAFHRWRAKVERIGQVTTLPDPRFSYAHFIEDIQTRTGPQRQRFSLDQAFPWFGVLGLRGDVASAEADAAWRMVEAERLMVVRAIEDAYHEYAYLAQAIRIDDENLRLLRQLEPVVQRRVQTGGNQEDLLRLQVEIGRLENELASMRDYRPALSARLAVAMNADAAVVLPLPEGVAAEPVALEFDEMLERVRVANPALAGIRERIEGARKQAELAERSSWPDLTIGADYFETGDALNPATPGSGDDPIALRVSMSLPIWRGKYAAQVREAESAEAAARSELHAEQTRLRAELEQRVFELDDAGRQIALYNDTLLPRAREAFELTQSSYRAARATVLDVIDAERTLLTFEKSYWRAVSNYRKSIAALEALCGGSLR